MPVVYPTEGPVLTKRHFVSVVLFKNLFSSIYDFPFVKVQSSSRASLYRSFTSLFCNCPHQSDFNGATCIKHAHIHTSTSQPWYVRHASTTPENDLYLFSGLSFPQWCSPSGAQNFVKQQPTHYSQTCKHSPLHSPQLSQWKEHVWTILMRPDHS